MSALTFDPKAARSKAQPVREDVLEWRAVTPRSETAAPPAMTAKTAKTAKYQGYQQHKTANLELNSSNAQPVRHGLEKIRDGLAARNPQKPSRLAGLAGLAAAGRDAPKTAAVPDLAEARRYQPARVPSWSDITDTPQPGDTCGSCRGSRFWTEATNPRGWRCATCHPPLHLPPFAVRRLPQGD
jgi:hypothetical protein